MIEKFLLKKYKNVMNISLYGSSVYKYKECQDKDYIVIVEDDLYEEETYSIKGDDIKVYSIKIFK